MYGGVGGLVAHMNAVLYCVCYFHTLKLGGVIVKLYSETAELQPIGYRHPVGLWLF